MTTAQLKETMREVAREVIAELLAHDKEVRKRLTRIEQTVSGESPDAIPWHNPYMNRAKRSQVDAVYEFMHDKTKSESERTVSNACRQTFAYIKSGFHSWTQLKSYCYRPHVRDYLESHL